MARSHGQKPVEKRSRQSTHPGVAADWRTRPMGHTYTAMPFCFERRTSVAPPGLVCFPCLRSTGSRTRCSAPVASLDLRHACGHASPQRGSHMSAQGIALGLRLTRQKSPEGAQQTINFKRAVHQTKKRWRLENLAVAPFQGSAVLAFRSPGRCPGLTCRCPFRANNDRTRGVDPRGCRAAYGRAGAVPGKVVLIP